MLRDSVQVLQAEIRLQPWIGTGLRAGIAIAGDTQTGFAADLPRDFQKFVRMVAELLPIALL